jgi:hypothetical protein
MYIRLIILAAALALAACASSDTRPRDPYSLSRPSNSSFMFPGEYRLGPDPELPLYRLPQF